MNLNPILRAAPAALMLTASAASLSVIAPVAHAAEPQVARAVVALRAIGTMRADFVQTDRNGQRVAGVMTLKRPGRIRFQYQKGVPLLVVSDGKGLTLIDYQVNQVQRWPIRNSPLGALLDPGRDVAAFASAQATGNPDVTSIAVRDPKHPEYGVITMIFVRDASAPGGMELSSWVALDAQNRRTTVRLANQRYGLAVPDSVFAWRDPRPGNRK